MTAVCLDATVNCSSTLCIATIQTIWCFYVVLSPHCKVFVPATVQLAQQLRCAAVPQDNTYSSSAVDALLKMAHFPTTLAYHLCKYLCHLMRSAEWKVLYEVLLVTTLELVRNIDLVQ